MAWNAEQAARLDDVLAKARANGYERAARIDLDELARREPHLARGATGAVAIPDESIICPWSPSIAFATEAVGAGVELRLGMEVADVGRDGRRSGCCTPPGDRSGPTGWSTRPGSAPTSSTGASATTSSPSRPGGASSSSSTSWPAGSCPPLCCRSPPNGRRASWWRRRCTATCSWARRPRTSTTAATPSPRRPVSTVCSTPVDAYCPTLVEEEVTATYAGIRAATEHRDYQITDPRGGALRLRRGDPLHRPDRIAGDRRARRRADGGRRAVAGRGGARAGDPLTCPSSASAPTRAFEDERLVRGRSGLRPHCVLLRARHRGRGARRARAAVPATDLGGLRRRTRATNGRCQGFFCGAAIAARLAQR